MTPEILDLLRRSLTKAEPVGESFEIPWRTPLRLIVWGRGLHNVTIPREAFDKILDDSSSFDLLDIAVGSRRFWGLRVAELLA